MKTYKLFVLILGLMVFTTTLNAQSRKEVIESLTRQADSLNKLLQDKSDSLRKVEIKLAKMEGAAEANQVFFNQYQNKTDSLSKSLAAKDSLINNLNSQVTKLKASIYEFEESKKEMASKNETLQAELNTYKQNDAAAQPGKKDTKVNVEPANAASKTNENKQAVKPTSPE